MNVVLNHIIQSENPSELRDELVQAFEEANRNSITEFHYSSTLLKNSHILTEQRRQSLQEWQQILEYPARTTRTAFALGIQNGRMIVEEYDPRNSINSLKISMDCLQNSNGDVIVFYGHDTAIKAAATIAPYDDLNNHVQVYVDKKQNDVEKLNDVVTVKSLTEVGDMISKGLMADNDFTKALADLNETELKR